MTDERILSGMQAGQQEALEALMQKYRRYVTTVIANIIGFFASDDSKALTGQVVVSDFGASL